MKWLATVLGLGLLGARWGMVTMDDTALRDDVLFSEMLTSPNNTYEVDAARLAAEIERATKKRKCELVPDSLQVDVKDSRLGQLRVQGAGLTVQGKGRIPIQDIDIRFACRRPGTLFVKTKAEYRLSTQAPGDGKANHWPRSDEGAGAAPQ